MTQHTFPETGYGSYKYHHERTNYGFVIRSSSSGKAIAEIFSSSEEALVIADLIVRACNEYLAELLEALAASRLLHTPGPWKVDPKTLEYIIQENVSYQDTIAWAMGQLSNINIANAEFIVRACNEYYDLKALNAELLEALIELLSSIGSWTPPQDDSDNEQARNAIARAYNVVAKAKGE